VFVKIIVIFCCCYGTAKQLIKETSFEHDMQVIQPIDRFCSGCQQLCQKCRVLPSIYYTHINLRSEY
jgi:hypothetical protein